MPQTASATLLARVRAGLSVPIESRPRERPSHAVVCMARKKWALGLAADHHIVAIAPVAETGLEPRVDLPAIGAFEIDAVIAMSVDGAADCRVGDLLFRHLPDMQCLLVADIAPVDKFLT